MSLAKIKFCRSYKVLIAFTRCINPFVSRCLSISNFSSLYCHKVYTIIVKLSDHRVMTDIMAKSLRHDCGALMEEILARRTFLDASVLSLRNLLNNFLFAMLSQEKLVSFQFDCDYLSLVCHSIRHSNFLLKDDYIHLRNEHKKRTYSLVMTQKQHIKLCVSIVNIAYAVAHCESTVFLPKDTIKKLGLQVQTTQIELNP